MNSKVVIAVIVAIVAVAAVVTVVMVNQDNGDHEDIPPSPYTFTAGEKVTGTNIELPAYYSDSYFDKKSTEFNQELMSFALSLQLSSGIYVDDYKDKPTSVLKFLTDIGCEKVYANNDYYEKSTLTSIDVAIGAKQYDGYTILFVVPNGSHYFTQFASNLMVGGEGPHEGFHIASVETLSALNEFIDSNEIRGDVKILLTGYSRSSAVVNLLGAYICDSIVNGEVKHFLGDIDMGLDDLYCFGFEVPFCGYVTDGEAPPTDSRYDGIWYTVNPADVVTYVPPDSYGFVRYGNKIELPSMDPDMKAKMIKGMKKLFHKETVDKLNLPDFVIIDSIVDNPQKMVAGFRDELFQAIGTRDYYYDEIQEDMVQTVYAFMCHSGMFKEMIEDGCGGYVKMIRNAFTYCGTDEFYDIFAPGIGEVAAKYGCPECTDNIVGAMDQVAQALKRFVGGNVAKLLEDKYLLTLIANYKYPISSHYTEMTFCYVIMDDPNYVAYFS